MGRTCTICAHPKASEINAELLSGTPARQVAKKWGCSEWAMYRHRESHIGLLPGLVEEDEELKRIVEERRAELVEELQGSERFEGRLRELRRKLDRLLLEAEVADDKKLQLETLREARALLKLEAEVVIGMLGLKDSDADRELVVRYESVENAG